jgi:hypothetical protein
MNVRNVSRSWRSPLALAVIGSGLLIPGLARAESDSEAAETAAARALAVDGVKLAQADDCEAAVEKLDRAERLKHSPIVLRYLGQCQIKLGRWVEGSESLRKLLRDPLPEQPTPALEQAYSSAAAQLKEINPLIPKMTVNVTAPPDTDVLLKVDGKPVADSVIGVALPANPGTHQIEASAPGFLPARSSIELEPSGNAVVTLELERDPSYKPTPAVAPVVLHTTQPAAPPQHSEPPPSSGSNLGKVFGFVSYGVAAAGLAGGILWGRAASQDEEALAAACPGHVCPPEQKDALSEAKTKGTLSTIGFAVAGAGLTFGTILLVTSSGSDSSKSGSAPGRQTAKNGLRPRALIGPTSVTLAADF